MVTPVGEPTPDVPNPESRSPSALYWTAIALLIVGLLATCAALVIIASLRR